MIHWVWYLFLLPCSIGTICQTSRASFQPLRASCPNINCQLALRCFQVSLVVDSMAFLLFYFVGANWYGVPYRDFACPCLNTKGLVARRQVVRSIMIDILGVCHRGRIVAECQLCWSSHWWCGPRAWVSVSWIGCAYCLSFWIVEAKCNFLPKQVASGQSHRCVVLYISFHSMAWH